MADSEPAGNPISAYPPFYKVAAGEHSLDANPETFRYFRVRAVNNAIYPSAYQGPLEGHSPWSAVAEITSAPTVQLTAHRTGGHFGDAVSRSVQDGNNPGDFVVLTNNDYEEHDDFSAKDFDDDTALIVDDQVQGNGDGPADDDLVQLTLSQLPSTLTDGTFTLAASDPTAVRFFDDQGQELTSLSVNLADPSGYLAGVMTGGVDVWMEGLHKDSDLIINTGYTDPAGNEIARDTVHMLLAEWNFVDSNGTSVTRVQDSVKQYLLDESNGDPGLPIDDDQLFKTKIDGLPSDDLTSLTYTSDEGDTFNDTIASNTSVSESSDYTALYVSKQNDDQDRSNDMTTAQRTLVAQALQVNVVHNPTTQVAATTQSDVQIRNIAAKKLTKEDWQKAALAKAGIDPAKWVPENGFAANKQNVEHVYAYYERLFKTQPSKLLWAGLAKMAGGAVYNGLKDLRWLIDSDQRWLTGLAGAMASPEQRQARATAYAAEVATEIKFLTMHRAIFYDLAWQHEAYINGGIAEIQRLHDMAQPIIDSKTLEAWQDIDSGDASVNTGNGLLLEREQKTILQPYYDQVGTIPGVIAGWMADSPLPGGRSFNTVEGLTSSISNQDKRWDWITKDMLPLWEAMPASQRIQLVNAPLGSQVQR